MAMVNNSVTCDGVTVKRIGGVFWSGACHLARQRHTERQ